MNKKKQHQANAGSYVLKTLANKFELVFLQLE